MKPNILCVGFSKCGTTTLYDIMKQHPDICLSGIKEPIYYGSKELVKKRGFEWYIKRYYPPKSNKKIIMEINPILGRDVPAIQIKKDYGKNIKIIFLIRNPINRMYSEFKMNLLDGTCFPKLKDNINSSTSFLFDKWIKNNFILKDNKYILLHNYSTKFVESGNYYCHIKEYINIFGKDNVQIIIFEDFVKNPKEICLKIFDFINVKCTDNIKFNLHSNKGNRLPKSEFSIKAIQIWFKIYKQILIEKLPFISENVCKFLNYLTWHIPIIFSKPNNNSEKISKKSRDIIVNYYSDMVLELSNFLDINLFEKWNIIK